MLIEEQLRMEALIDKTIKEDEARRLAREEKNTNRENNDEEA